MSTTTLSAGLVLADHLYAKASLFDLVRIFDGSPIQTTPRRAAGVALAARLKDLEESTGCVTGWETIL